MVLSQTQVVVDENGCKTGVLMTLKKYEKLMEDLHDLAVIAERRNEKPISLKELRQGLEKDGLLQGRT